MASCLSPLWLPVPARPKIPAPTGALSQLEDQLAALEEDQARTAERLDEQAQRIQELEEVASRAAAVLPAIEQWFQGQGRRVAVA